MWEWWSRTRPGYQTTHTPTEHCTIFSPGQLSRPNPWTRCLCGNKSNQDGSVIISESKRQAQESLATALFDGENSKTIYLCYWKIEKDNDMDTLQQVKPEN